MNTIGVPHSVMTCSANDHTAFSGEREFNMAEGGRSTMFSSTNGVTPMMLNGN